MQMNDSTNLSFYDDKQQTTRNAEFSIPELILNQSMHQYQIAAKQKIQMSIVVEQITSLVIQTIDKLLHQRIYQEISKIINEVLCIREQVSTFSKEESQRQQQINVQLKSEIKKMKLKIEGITMKNNMPIFNNIMNNHSKKPIDDNRVKSVQGLQFLVKDVYDFMEKNNNCKLIKECQQKIQKYQEMMSINHQKTWQKIEQIKNKQKPINQNLRKQMSDALSKDKIDKQIKKVIKENIKYILDEIIRCRKDVDMLKQQMMGLSNRQKEVQFNQTLIQHKLF